MAKPLPPAPAQLPPTTQGPIDRVPCPHCGKPNNFKGHYEMLDPGNVFACDHCKNPMQVAGVRDVKVILLRKPRGQVTMIKSQK